MTLSEAVAKRISKLLIEKQMTQYRLEIKSGVLHGTMNHIIAGRTKNIMLGTVAMIARGFDMTLQEFLDDDIFKAEDLEIE